MNVIAGWLPLLILDYLISKTLENTTFKKEREETNLKLKTIWNKY